MRLNHFESRTETDVDFASAMRTATHTVRKSSTTTDEHETRLDPIHPGEVLKQDFMVPLGLSDSALATAIGVTPARINEIVRGRRGITAETALRLARYFRTGPNSWMNLQDHYEIVLAEKALADALQSIQPREVG